MRDRKILMIDESKVYEELKKYFKIFLEIVYKKLIYHF